MQKFDFKFEAAVHTLESHCGQLAKVVVDPKSWQLTSLIVEDGLLFKRTAVFPIDDVEDTISLTIHLKILDAQLKNYPEFHETTIEKGAPTWQSAKTAGEAAYFGLPSANIPNMTVVREKARVGVDNDALILDNKTKIKHQDGQLGHLSHVIVDPNDFLITNVVSSHGILLSI